MRVLSNLVILFSLLICSTVESSQLDSYQNQINYNCTLDSDCEIKNIGDCCGYYPKCVNSEANIDPEFVSITCEKEGLVSGCGYQDVDICECISGQCIGDNKKNREFQELIKIKERSK